MNFWDLGMVSTGPSYIQWQMLDFQPSACPLGTSSQTFNTTWHEELLDKIFEQPVETWRTYYKKIVPDMNYPLEIRSRDLSGSFLSTSYDLSSAPEFSDQGLKVESTFFNDDKLLTTNFTGGDPALFRSQFLENGASPTFSGTKVTTTYDPGASNVAFQPKKNCDVFLVPALPYALCRYEYYESGGTPSHFDKLNEFFYLLDRGVMITPGHDMYGATKFVNFRNTGAGEEGSQTEYDDFKTIAEHFKTFDNARASYNGGAAADPAAFGAILPPTYSYTPPGTFTEGIAHMAASFDGNTSNTAITSNSDNQMLLRAVIYQDGQYYYIWNNENT